MTEETAQAGEPKRLPLVFACAGCSQGGRLAYDIALELDRMGVAEMSCLAGVAAGKKPFHAKLRGREVWVIDGCPIACAEGVFAQWGTSLTRYIRLDELGIKKKTAYDDGADASLLARRLAAGLLSGGIDDKPDVLYP